jgi:hypothetical protein
MARVEMMFLPLLQLMTEMKRFRLHPPMRGLAMRLRLLRQMMVAKTLISNQKALPSPGELFG